MVPSCFFFKVACPQVSLVWQFMRNLRLAQDILENTLSWTKCVHTTSSLFDRENPGLSMAANSPSSAFNRQTFPRVHWVVDHMHAYSQEGNSLLGSITGRKKELFQEVYKYPFFHKIDKLYEGFRNFWTEVLSWKSSRGYFLYSCLAMKLPK